MNQIDSQDTRDFGPFFKTVVVFVGAIAFLCAVLMGWVAFNSSFIAEGFYPPAKVDQGDVYNNSVDAIFGTIQFAVAILSGLIILFAVVLSAFVGRTLSETQKAARTELAEFARLYKENFESFEKTMDIKAANAVNLYLGESDVRKTLDSYRSVLDEMRKHQETMDPVIKEYQVFTIAKEGRETDYAGPYLKWNKEWEKINELGDEEEEARFLSEHRQEIRNALLLLEEGALKRKAGANDAFNGAQMASRMNFSELEHRLAVCANWLHTTVLYQARVFRSEHARGDRLVISASEDDGTFSIKSENPTNERERSEAIRQEALEKVFGLFGQGSFLDAHLIFSEIWNVSLRAGSLDDYIVRGEQAIASDVEHGREIPSYAFAQMARAYALHGADGWQEKAMKFMDLAKAKLQVESPINPFYPHTLNELNHPARAFMMAAQMNEAGME